MKSRLDVRGVVKVLGGARVLRGVDAEFRSGRVHVIEGANGSGKSTLLAILGGRLAPTRGTVSADFLGLACRGAPLRGRVGWLGHELGLYPDLTAEENIALHAEIRGVSSEGAWGEAGARLGVQAVRHRRVRELSRGQRQRVALLRVVLGAPAVLLLDEPSTGLDAQTTPRLVDLLEAEVARGTLVVVVTHDAAFRDGLSTAQSWRLEGGRLAQA